MKTILRLSLAALGILGLAPFTRADVVTDWNTRLLNAIRVTSLNPPRASRAMAMTHLAMFEAVNGIEKRYQRYHIVGNPEPNASAKAAAAAAAHRVLSALFSTQTASFDEQLARSLAGLSPGPRQRGIQWGQTCADDMLALRANDNSNLVVTYTPVGGPGVWIATPPGFLPALLPNWPQVTPFCMNSGDELRSNGPPELTSEEFALAFNEVKLLGQNTSTARTADETQIAFFWADGPATITPPGHWMDIAQDVALQQGNNVVENARLFALLGMAVADAAIVSWDNKYAYNDWRPVTGIRDAETDGNPATVDDDTWTPLIGTPPFPSYTSGHSTFSSSAAKVLERFFHNDEIAFSSTSDGLPNVVRNFSGFSEAAGEAGQSRILGGIHWQYDNQDAQAGGRVLGDLVYDNFLGKIADLTNDDCVSLEDLFVLLGEMGATSSPADLNGDGIVNNLDRRLLLQNLESIGPCY